MNTCAILFSFLVVIGSSLIYTASKVNYIFQVGLEKEIPYVFITSMGELSKLYSESSTVLSDEDTHRYPKTMCFKQICGT